ncbi:MAG: High-affnity carbon uptake protein Hat/HatR [Cyclobacteriaceae bacterium]|nr:High-affnity carbon uptake protein Hat/HatR [Cyclobacteriaceae bacterium]
MSPFFNPFPGLRPFKPEESHLFFGREGQSDEVLDKLAKNRFVGVIGPSGSGKSSFVYCGVLPNLHGGFIADKMNGWKVIVTRPGAKPIQSLSHSIAKEFNSYGNAEEEEQLIRTTIAGALLKSTSHGLVQAIKRSPDFGKKNFLILVDQFEELFRYKSEDADRSGENSAMAYVNLLLEAVRQEEVPIYVAITMRSDFIGDCAHFPLLTKYINDSHYLIPQMTREQKKDAILGPVAVGGGMITERLIQQLLNDLGNRTDQLPILQHSLMRTWNYWTKNREVNEPLDIHHYESIGGMAEALSQHANEAYHELNERQKELCAIIFKTITEKRGDKDGIRRPTPLRKIAQIANADLEQISEVIHVFRKSGRSLLIPAEPQKLTEDSIIDISHESLMRIWVRLRNWVNEEAESVQMYLRLAEAASMYQIGKAGLWRPPDLQIALNWQEKQRPTLDWGVRFDSAFERTMGFLEFCREEYEKEQRIKELMQKKALQRARITVLVMTAATVVSILFLIYAFTQQVKAEREAEIAAQQTQIAIENERRAERESERAKEESERANEARVDAERAQEQAIFEAQRAEEQRRAADFQKELAQKAEQEAKSQTKIAEDRKAEAEAAQDFAILKAEEAERNALQAERERMISIAKSLAIKSTQISQSTRKALLAQQAFIFHQRYDGNIYDNDIYDGLYYAVKAVKEEGYNQLIGHTDNVRSILSSNQANIIYSLGSDGKMIRWDLSEQNIIAEELLNQEGIFRSGALSKNGDKIFLAGSGSILIAFNFEKGTVQTLSSPPVKNIQQLVAGQKNDRLFLLGDSRKIYLIDQGEQQLIYEANHKVNQFTVDPTEQYLALSQNNGEAILIHLKDNFNKETIYTSEKGDALHALAFHPKAGELIFGNDRGNLLVYNIKEGKIEQNLEGHGALINQITFSPDRMQMATASFDRTVRLWKMDNLNDQPIVLSDHDDWVWSIAFSQDSKFLLAGCRDRIIRKWPTRAAFMGDIICSEIEQNKLSLLEWDRYIGADVPFEATCEP